MRANWDANAFITGVSDDTDRMRAVHCAAAGVRVHGLGRRACQASLTGVIQPADTAATYADLAPHSVDAVCLPEALLSSA